MAKTPVKGRIVKGVGGFYDIAPNDDPIERIEEIRARGSFRHKRIKPAVGDEVILGLTPEGDYVIDEILKRRNALIRPSVVNVDVAILCFSLTKPKADLELLDKLLIYCQMENVSPIICFTKRDTDKKNQLERYREIYKQAGFPVLAVSAVEDEGFDALTDLIQGKTAFLAGPSGVGKSTLINRLVEKEMDTGELSKKLGRGRHTTRHVELIPSIAGGWLVDTPGFSNLEFEQLDPDFEAEDLRQYYREFEDKNCRFDNCVHIKEPDCAVRDAVREGSLSKERYLNYKRLFTLLKERKRY